MKRKRKHGCGSFGCLAAGVLLSCSGLVLFGLHENSLTPAQRAERERRLRHEEANREREARIADGERAKKAERDAEVRERERQDSESRVAEHRERQNASTAAKEFAKRGLSHPSTASFPWTPPSVTKAHDGTWIVTGTVKAKNSFNLETTIRYSCRVRRDGGDWTLIDRQMSE